MTSEIEAAVEYLKSVLPLLLASGNNWQLTLHGGKAGDILFEQKMTGKVCEPRKQTVIDERRNGHR